MRNIYVVLEKTIRKEMRKLSLLYKVLTDHM